MLESFKIRIITKLAHLWDVPPEKLLALYRLYQETALSAGRLSAVFRSFGFVLDRRRIKYMIIKIRKMQIKSNDKKFPL